MAVYKVIQDIEAEDKLLGPLTLKGFIYAGIAVVLAFINFRIVITTGLGPVRWVLAPIFFLPMLLFGVLAAPLGKNQSTEVWLLSHVRFLLKPRRRIWDQSGISHLVTITVPKKIEKQLTKGLSQSEVKSRLEALAMTLDSRGWAVKNVDVNLSPVPGYFQTDAGDSDRLIGTSSLSQPTSVVDVHPSDDILDEQNNATAHYFNELMKVADAKRKQSISNMLNVARGSNDQSTSSQTETSALTPDEQAFLTHQQQDEKELDSARPYIGTFAEQSKQRQKFIEQQEHSSSSRQQLKPNEDVAVNDRKAVVTAARQADKMELAQAGNGLSVASIAKLANRAPNEVVIKLH